MHNERIKTEARGRAGASVPHHPNIHIIPFVGCFIILPVCVWAPWLHGVEWLLLDGNKPAAHSPLAFSPHLPTLKSPSNMKHSHHSWKTWNCLFFNSERLRGVERVVLPLQLVPCSAAAGIWIKWGAQQTCHAALCNEINAILAIFAPTGLRGNFMALQPRSSNEVWNKCVSVTLVKKLKCFSHACISTSADLQVDYCEICHGK